MFRLLFLLLLLVPLIEVYLFVQVGSLIGALPTVILCIFTAFAGTWLFRLQGMQTVRRVQQKLQQRDTPAVDLVEALILAIAGLLLLVPAFFSDFIGLLCLIPALRTRLAYLIIGRLARLQPVNAKRAVILEGEYWEDKDKRLR